MAEKVERQVVKSMDEVDFSKGTPAELEIDVPVDGDTSEVVYEGGPLDGKRGDAAAEDGDMIARIEKRRADEAAKAKEAAPKDQVVTPDPKEEADLPELEVDPKTGTERIKAPGEGGGTGTADYTPKLTYRVYDQEKTFPEWAKPLVTSEDSEKNLRDLFEKSDGLDEMKPKHQQVVRERDEAIRAVNEQAMKVQRLINLRQSNPAQLFHEMGITDGMVLTHAKTLLDASEDSSLAAAYQQQRQREIQFFATEAQALPVRSAEETAFRQAHDVATQQTFSTPDVSAYQTSYDKLYGAGSFKTQCDRYGLNVFQGQQRYAPPNECVKAIMTHYGPIMAAQPPPQQTAPAAAQAGSAQSQLSAPRPRAMPRVGIGHNASPTKQRLRSLDDVKKQVELELNS